jgi:hypothetical protein
MKYLGRHESDNETERSEECENLTYRRGMTEWTVKIITTGWYEILTSGNTNIWPFVLHEPVTEW